MSITFNKLIKEKKFNALFGSVSTDINNSIERLDEMIDKLSDMSQSIIKANDASINGLKVFEIKKSECKLYLPTYRISAVGMGYFKPKVSNDNEINRTKNRRIEIKKIIPLSMNTIQN